MEWMGGQQMVTNPMTEVATKLCSDCAGPLVRTAEGHGDCGFHTEDQIVKRRGYVIDLHHPGVSADWMDGPDKACVPLELLPEPQDIWVSKGECCAWWIEPDWEDDYCAMCRDYMEPLNYVAVCKKCGHKQAVKNWCEKCGHRTEWDIPVGFTESGQEGNERLWCS